MSERLKRWIAGASWFYLLISIVWWGILRVSGDGWWMATVFLFGPRWICVLPLVPLILAAALIHRRSLWILLLAAWVVLFPLMNLSLPWRLVIPHFQSGPHIRVLTCNLHGTKIEALAGLIAEEHPDIVAVQEESSRRPLSVFGGREWHTFCMGEWVVASRYPIGKTADIALKGWPAPGGAVCCELEAPFGRIPFINLHLASPHQQLESVRWRSPSAPVEMRSNSAVRATQSRIVGGYAEDLGPATLVAGDFNTPEGSPVFKKYWSSFSSAFSMAGWGLGHTYYTRRVSMRIDHILAGDAWRCRGCRVGPDIGSAHRPLIAEFEFIRPD